MAHLEFHNNLVDISTVFYQSHADLIRNICIELDAVDRVKEFEEKYLDKKLKLKPKNCPMFVLLEPTTRPRLYRPSNFLWKKPWNTFKKMST